jgi:hypothetical protein
MKTMTEYVQKIQRIVQIANQTDSTWDELHGINIELGIALDEKTLARFREINIGEESLKHLLQSMDLGTLQRLQALMYSGRDGQSAPFIKQDFLSRYETKEDIVSTIMEKRMSLQLYLDRGLEQARKEGVDIDSF